MQALAAEGHEVAVTFFRNRLGGFTGQQYRTCLTTGDAEEHQQTEESSSMEQVVAACEPEVS